VPSLPLDTQKAIAAKAEREKAQLSVALSDIDAAIALAKERRAALITAAVTGQVDVTTRQRPAIDSGSNTRATQPREGSEDAR
jgi:type I restriction enzyme S subunit